MKLLREQFMVPVFSEKIELMVLGSKLQREEMDPPMYPIPTTKRMF
jgi:hypothetical protein